MRIRLTREHIHNQVTIPAGRVLDLPTSLGRFLIAQKVAINLETEPASIISTPPPTILPPDGLEAGGAPEETETPNE